MNKQKELAKNTLILTVGKICTQFISFLLLPLYTALLLPEEFGVVDLFNTYIMLLVPIFNWQFENGLFRFMLDCRDNEEMQKTVFSTVFTVNIVQVIIYLIFYIVAQRFIISDYKIFLAFDVALNIFLNTLLQLPRGLGNNAIYAVGSFISATSTVVFNVILIAGFRMGAYGMFIATVASKVITIIFLCCALRAWKYYSIRYCNKGKFKEICKYTIPLIPNQLSWWVVGTSDRMVVSHFISVAANGLYSVANKFSTVYITFYNIFNMSWTESVSIHMNDSDRDVFLTDTVNSMFRLFSATCLEIIVCMPFVFPIMVNSQYDEAYMQIPILMIAVLFQVIVGLYSVIYVALKKSVEIAKTSFYAAIINLGTNLIMIKFIGLYAASVSTLLAFSVMAIYRYFNVKKYVNIVLRKRTVLLTVLIGIVSVCSYYYNNLIINITTFVLVTVYSVVINKQFIKSTMDTVLQRFKCLIKNR